MADTMDPKDTRYGKIFSSPQVLGAVEALRLKALSELPPGATNEERLAAIGKIDAVVASVEQAIAKAFAMGAESAANAIATWLAGHTRLPHHPMGRAALRGALERIRARKWER